MIDSNLGNFRTFAAMDLKAAANRRRHAATLGHHVQMRRRLLDNARFLIIEARRCRLAREAAQHREEAEKHIKAGDAIAAALALGKALTADLRA